MYQASLIYAFIIGLELIWSNYYKKKIYKLKEILMTIYLSLINLFIDILIRGLYLLVLNFCFELALFQIEHSLLYWLSLIFLLDFQFYWLHRLEHYSRLF